MSFPSNPPSSSTSSSFLPSQSSSSSSSPSLINSSSSTHQIAVPVISTHTQTNSSSNPIGRISNNQKTEQQSCLWDKEYENLDERTMISRLLGIDISTVHKQWNVKYTASKIGKALMNFLKSLKSIDSTKFTYENLLICYLLLHRTPYECGKINSFKDIISRISTAKNPVTNKTYLQENFEKNNPQKDTFHIHLALANRLHYTLYHVWTNETDSEIIAKILALKDKMCSFNTLHPSEVSIFLLFAQLTACYDENIQEASKDLVKALAEARRLLSKGAPVGPPPIFASLTSNTGQKRKSNVLTTTSSTTASVTNNPLNKTPFQRSQPLPIQNAIQHQNPMSTPQPLLGQHSVPYYPLSTQFPINPQPALKFTPNSIISRLNGVQQIHPNLSNTPSNFSTVPQPNMMMSMPNGNPLSKKRRIDDMPQYQKSALLKRYQEPELWHTPPKLNDIIKYISGSECDNIDQISFEEISTFLDRSVDFCPPSYKQIIYLFFLQLELEKRGENSQNDKNSVTNLCQKIDTLLQNSMKQLSEVEQGTLIRYANLIHTPASERGNTFRSLIAQTLLKPLYNEDKPWLSVYQRLTDIIQLCKELESNPNPAKTIIFLTSDEAVKKFAKQLRKRCLDWLLELKSGNEVVLPALYHGTKKTNPTVIPHEFLADQIKETSKGTKAGAFISTRMELMYFSPGLAFPMEILFVPEHNLMNFFIPQGNKNETLSHVRWIGLRQGIPIALTDPEFNLKGHNVAAVIVPDNQVEKQRTNLPAALANACIMEQSEAFLFEYYLTNNSPAFIPKYYPPMKNFDSSLVHEQNAERVHTRKTWPTMQALKMLGELAGPFNESVCDPGLAFFAYQIRNPLTLVGYFKLLEKNPEQARRLSMQGYFSKNIPLRVEENIRSMEAMQSRLRVRNKRMKDIQAAFPEIPQIKSPALHATWPHLNLNHKSFGTVQGYNPYLIINF